jgi:glycosyltransferase involved in cell wall biosynthesis
MIQLERKAVGSTWQKRPRDDSGSVLSLHMKLVVVTTGLGIGGAEMMLLKLLERIDRQRFSPQVISLMDKGPIGARIEALGVPVYALRMPPGQPSLAGMYHLHKLIVRLLPDLIHGWMYHGNLAALVAQLTAARHARLIWSVRGTNTDLRSESALSSVVHRLCGYLSGYPARTIVNSRASATAHTKDRGYPADKWEVIPNGFDTERFAPSSAARAVLRQQLGLPAQAVVIGQIGRYHPMKDHRTFLVGAARLLRQHPSTRFVLAGREVTQDNPELFSWVRELGLTEAVLLLGERSDVPQLNAALDIATSSSWTESFPNVLGEAMACEVPCVATDVGDSAWIVGGTGRVVPARDPAALAAAWGELIQMGAEARNRLGKAARERVIANFSLDSVVRRYEEVYAGLAKSSSS